MVSIALLLSHGNNKYQRRAPPMRSDVYHFTRSPFFHSPSLHRPFGHRRVPNPCLRLPSKCPVYLVPSSDSCTPSPLRY